VGVTGQTVTKWRKAFGVPAEDGVTIHLILDNYAMDKTPR